MAIFEAAPVVTGGTLSRPLCNLILQLFRYLGMACRVLLTSADVPNLTLKANFFFARCSSCNMSMLISDFMLYGNWLNTAFPFVNIPFLSFSYFSPLGTVELPPHKSMVLCKKKQTLITVMCDVEHIRIYNFECNA